MAPDADPSAALDDIARAVRPLRPPVLAFERQARPGRGSAFRTLVSVLLSSRTKDQTTGPAAERLFRAAATPPAMLALGEKRIASLIYPVGFYRTKARQIVALCRRLPASGRVPRDFAALGSLPGVGRKTANLVLALAFRRPAVAVDTHVFRISRRLGWARGETPAAVEKELETRFPPRLWRRINQVLVGFGQTLCRPRAPLCDRCPLERKCPYRSEHGGNVEGKNVGGGPISSGCVP